MRGWGRLTSHLGVTSGWWRWNSSQTRGWEEVVLLAFLETHHPFGIMNLGRQKGHECDGIYGFSHPCSTLVPKKPFYDTAPNCLLVTWKRPVWTLTSSDPQKWSFGSSSYISVLWEQTWHTFTGLSGPAGLWKVPQRQWISSSATLKWQRQPWLV